MLSQPHFRKFLSSLVTLVMVLVSLLMAGSILFDIGGLPVPTWLAKHLPIASMKENSDPASLVEELPLEQKRVGQVVQSDSDAERPYELEEREPYREIERGELNGELFQKITVTGTVHYDRLYFIDANPFQIREQLSSENYVLDRDRPEKLPSRGIEVCLSTGGHCVETTYTNESGAYKFIHHSRYPEQPYKVVVKARLKLDEETWHEMTAAVKDPSQADEWGQPVIYSASSNAFMADEESVQRDFYFKAELIDEWQSDLLSDYKSQPWAILDTIKKGADHFTERRISAPEHELNELKIYWSQNSGENAVINNAAGSYNRDRIYLSAGEAPLIPWRGERVISEWSEGVIIHEFGHFVLDSFIGRNDSTGGSHSALGKTSLPKALSEGFANALAFSILGSGRFQLAYAEGGSKGGMDLRHCDLSTERARDGNPIYQHSPFAETTVSWFISTLIDPEFNCLDDLSTDLASEIGFQGVIASLRHAKEQKSQLTIYSLAASAAELFPNQQDDIKALGKKLAMTLNGDQWGKDEVPIAAISDPVYQDGLPQEAYLPLYEGLEPDGSITSPLMADCLLIRPGALAQFAT